MKSVHNKVIVTTEAFIWISLRDTRKTWIYHGSAPFKIHMQIRATKSAIYNTLNIDF